MVKFIQLLYVVCFIFLLASCGEDVGNQDRWNIFEYDSDQTEDLPDISEDMTEKKLVLVDYNESISEILGETSTTRLSLSSNNCSVVAIHFIPEAKDRLSFLSTIKEIYLYGFQGEYMVTYTNESIILKFDEPINADGEFDFDIKTHRYGIGEPGQEVPNPIKYKVKLQVSEDCYVSSEPEGTLVGSLVKMYYYFDSKKDFSSPFKDGENLIGMIGLENVKTSNTSKVDDEPLKIVINRFCLKLRNSPSYTFGQLKIKSEKKEYFTIDLNSSQIEESICIGKEHGITISQGEILSLKIIATMLVEPEADYSISLVMSDLEYTSNDDTYVYRNSDFLVLTSCDRDC